MSARIILDFFLFILMVFGSRTSATLQDVFQSPFPGQGVEPPGSPLDVYVTVYLERLLRIDDVNFDFEAQLFIRFSWTDPNAAAEIAARTASLTGSDGVVRDCSRWCFNLAGRCCDTIWLPTVDFPNGREFSQGRPEREELGVGGVNNTAVFWQKTVQAHFYNSFNFAKFPFDRQALTVFFNGHGQGSSLNYIASSAAKSMQGPVAAPQSGKDPVSGWRVTSLALFSTLFEESNITSFATDSNADDPFPVTGPEISTLVPYGSNTLDLITKEDAEIIFIIMVKRLTAIYFYAYIGPLVASTLGSCTVFLMDGVNEVSTRTATLSFLFVTLTALQWTINSQVPTTVYRTTMDKLVLLSYVVISFVTLESVVVHFISRKDILHMHKHRKEKKERGPRALVSVDDLVRRESSVHASSTPRHSSSRLQLFSSQSSGSTRLRPLSNNDRSLSEGANLPRTPTGIVSPTTSNGHNHNKSPARRPFRKAGHTATSGPLNREEAKHDAPGAGSAVSFTLPHGRETIDFEPHDDEASPDISTHGGVQRAPEDFTDQDSVRASENMTAHLSSLSGGTSKNGWSMRRGAPHSTVELSSEAQSRRGLFEWKHWTRLVISSMKAMSKQFVAFFRQLLGEEGCKFMQAKMMDCVWLCGLFLGIMGKVGGSDMGSHRESEKEASTSSENKKTKNAFQGWVDAVQELKTQIKDREIEGNASRVAFTIDRTCFIMVPLAYIIAVIVIFSTGGEYQH
eukprot:TRINITY_DN6541_c0_g1_i1.p1 TRINITY_DN6541_c0_g1~~TRINITY_DN6541_c0_g1_i1.p1  ORF type:complete len:739 (-),score=77.98 TRINITY_DN6541_c0_g1_i1:458-2674(-)